MRTNAMKPKRVSEAEAQMAMAEQNNDYLANGEKLLLEYEGKKGLGFGNGELASLYQKAPYQAISLVKMIENTEKGVTGRLKEYQTSSYLGLTPQEIVKVFRFSYGNSIAQDLFNFWSMDTVKDTFYKIETQYDTTKRGATAGNTIYENYNDGRYPTAYDQDENTTPNGSLVTFTGTLSTVPLKAYSVRIFSADRGIIGNDDGNGALIGTDITAGTIDYTTGAYSVTFGTALVTGDVLKIEYGIDLEQEALFSEIGEVRLNLVPYDFRAIWHSMRATWHRYTEEVSQSKLGRSARQDLLDGVGDVIRKSFDEFFCSKVQVAAKWTTGLNFDANFSNQGADSDYANVQALVSTLEDARGLTYADLGRYSARTNLLVGYKAKSYLRKLNGYAVNSNKDEMGFFKDGEVQGYGVYVGPPSIVANNEIYLVGRGKDAMSTDAVISVGMYKGDINSDEIEFSSFKNEVGLGYMLDWKWNNKKMVTKVTLDNLPS